jgi:hypothetical protein
MLKPNEVENAPSISKERQCKEIEAWIDTNMKAGRFDMSIPRSGWHPEAIECVLALYAKNGWIISKSNGYVRFQKP